MSVNASMDNISLQAHLRASFAGWRPYQQPIHYQTRPPHRHPTQTMAATQQSQYQSAPFDATSEAFFANAQSEQGYHQNSFFNDNVDYRPEESTLFNAAFASPAIPVNYKPQSAYHPFRPFNSPPLDTPFADAAATEIGCTPTLSPFVLLQEDVDNTQYKVVSSEDLASAAIDYDVTSPSSIDSLESGPFTPTSPMANDDMFGLDTGKFPHGLPYVAGFDHRSLLAGSGSGAGFVRDDGAKGATMPEAALLGWTPFGGNHGHDWPGVPQRPQLPSTKYPLSIARATVTAVLPNAGRSTSADQIDQAAEVPYNGPSEAAHRRRRDNYLLDMRQQGYSYREIKRRGRFREAESTLRGRVRVLTKEKWERVRRPEWTDEDVRILRRAVERYASHLDEHKHAKVRDMRLPWKKISTWVKEHGGSYLFAPATCAKKWEEVKNQEQD